MKDCVQVINEITGCESVPPLLELWHLRVDSTTWLNLASSLTSGKTVIPKMILSDVALMEEESIQSIVEACVGVRLDYLFLHSVYLPFIISFNQHIL